MRRLGEIDMIIMEELFTNEKDKESRYTKCITIGRNLGNNIILDYPDVDCYHCRIKQVGEDIFRITDLDSANGTFVNGERVKDIMKIGSFDAVQVGSHKVAWIHQFADVDDVMKRKREMLRMTGLMPSTPIPVDSTSFSKDRFLDSDTDTMKKKRAELSKRLKKGGTIAFGEGGKIVDVDSDEAIGEIPPGKFSAMDSDEEMRKKREKLRKRLLNPEPIPMKEGGTVSRGEDKEIFVIPGFIYQIEVVDEYDNTLFISEEDGNLQSLLLPHVRIVVGHEEIPLKDIEKNLNWKLSLACGYICSLVRVAYGFYSREELSYSDMRTVAFYLLCPSSWGENIKLIIGTDIVRTIDFGKYFDQGQEIQSSVRIGSRVVGGSLHVDGIFPPSTIGRILCEIELYISKILERHPMIPDADANYSGWHQFSYSY